MYAFLHLYIANAQENANMNVRKKLIISGIENGSEDKKFMFAYFFVS